MQSRILHARKSSILNTWLLLIKGEISPFFSSYLKLTMYLSNTSFFKLMLLPLNALFCASLCIQLDTISLWTMFRSSFLASFITYFPYFFKRCEYLLTKEAILPFFLRSIFSFSSTSLKTMRSCSLFPSLLLKLINTFSKSLMTHYLISTMMLIF